MRFRRYAQTVRTHFARIDLALADYFRTHANLFSAGIVVTLGVWGLVTAHDTFFFCMLLIGASSYFFGLLASLVLSLACMFWVAHAMWGDRFITSLLLTQFTGFLSVAWLGYAHKEQAQKQSATASLATDSHREQVLPWAVANDIRTSLAAVRFLLFPLHEDKPDYNLQRASDELSRLESLFKQLEDGRKTTK